MTLTKLTDAMRKRAQQKQDPRLMKDTAHLSERMRKDVGLLPKHDRDFGYMFRM